MKDSPSLRFLYHTALGRAVLKVLTKPSISKLAGIYLDSPLSKGLIDGFIKKNQISLKGIDVPKRGFSSFNAFFSRKRKKIDFDRVPDHLTSPCDGLLSVFKIKKDTVLAVKQTAFTVGELLQDKKLAAEYEDGTALIFRLTPSHYHRYSYIADGTVRLSRKIAGILHCVRPIATEQFPVYVQNAREYQVVDSSVFGKIVQMEVGALLVGRISNIPVEPDMVVHRGQEKGYFEFGGSTIIVLIKEDTAAIRKEILDRINYDQEIPVHVGEWIGTAR